MSRKQEQEPEPTPTITATDTVRLTLPTPKFDPRDLLRTPPTRLQVATVDNLRDFIRAVEDRFGSYTDATLNFWSGGVEATETETL